MVSVYSITMKKEVIVLFLLGMLLVFPLVLAQEQFLEQSGEEHKIGPSAEEQSCVMDCMGCTSVGEDCTGNSEQCMEQCNVEKPEVTKETSCMEECVLEGCGKFDFTCQGKNQAKCEEECEMIGEPEAQSEEEQCIRDCVNKIDPNIRCQAGTEEGMGETGNEVCQECAKSCEHLYSGPCLNDEQWREKENVCIAQCEHCYGAPVRGPSGEGWDCTIDIKCEDASAEWGDNPGAGPDSWEEGHAPSEDNVYWGDYESNLEVSGSEGVLEIRNTNIKNIGKKVKVNIKGGEGVSLEKKEEKLIVKNDEVEVEIDNNLDELVISEKGNKREINNIDIEIEEGKPIYRYEEKERAKLLGFVPVSKDVKKKVDAEKMEVLEENGPWWEFLSVEEKEEILEK